MIAAGGRAWVVGDNVGTEQLAPGIYMKRPIAEIAPHCLENIEPRFAAEVTRGDIVVGGRNFGMGSSREQAVQALLELGVAAVLAKSYGGIFYRNAFNLGLLVLTCAETDRIKSADKVSVEPVQGTVHNMTRGETYACEQVPEHLMALVRAGGLVPYLEAKLKSQRAT
jgi:3-isopropylmalate dehydratase small subunit